VPLKNALLKYKKFLQENNPLPLYYQVQLILEDFITRGELEKGSPFFTEEEIVKQLGVSLPTVNRVMKTLIEKKYILRSRGKRAYINDPYKFQYPFVFMSELLAYGEMLERLGVKNSTKLLERKLITPSPKVKRYLGIEREEPVIYLKRIRYIKEEPILIVDSYLPKKYNKFLEIDEDDFSIDLYKLLAEYFPKKIVRAERELMASRVSLEDAILLDVPLWEACLRLFGIAYTNDGQRFEFFDSRLKGDRCILKSTLSKEI